MLLPNMRTCVDDHSYHPNEGLAYLFLLFFRELKDPLAKGGLKGREERRDMTELMVYLEETAGL